MTEEMIVRKPDKVSKGKRYSNSEVDQILLQLAANGGKLKPTMEQTGVSMTTLSNWKQNKYIERYNELLKSHGNDLKQRTLATARERLGEIDATQRKFVIKLDAMVEAGDLSPGDAAKALDSLTRAKKAEHEAIASMENRPTVISVEHNGAGPLERLAKAGLIVIPEVIEATAEEIAA